MSTSAQRPRIYALYATRNHLREFGGDMISELATLRWMSRVADVYYNNVLFDPASDIAGDPDRAVSNPVGRYDLVYVRGNVDVLKAANLEGCPTLFFGAPSALTITSTTYFAAHTEGEAERIRREGVAFGATPECLLIEQPGRDDIKPQRDSPHTEAFRFRWGSGFHAGFFGRIDAASMPDTFMGVRDVLRHQIHDLSIIFAGKVQWKFNLPDDVFQEPNYFTVSQMSYALSACDVTIGIEQPEAEWAGSNRALDAIRSQVPILTRPYGARVEQLGVDYPLFFSDASTLVDKLVRYRFDAGFRQETIDYLARLGPQFRVEEIEKRNAARLCERLAWPVPAELSASV